MLLAHDLTGPSEVALVRAARLTLDREGHLTILHVVNSELPADVIARQRTHARSHLEAEVRRWLGRYKLPYRIDIGIGDPASAIAARAQAYNVDLVVTGRHQRCACADSFTPAFVGRLLRQSERPILVVGNSNQSPYRRVLIPIDFTNASAAGIEFAAAFLPRASLHLLHAYRRRFRDHVEAARFTGVIGQNPRQALSSFATALGLGERRPVVTIANGDALVRLKEELARQKTDLLVLGTQLRCGLEHTPLGRAADAVLGSSPCDMLFPSFHGPS